MEGKPAEKISFLTSLQVKAYKIWLVCLIAVIVLVVLVSIYGIMIGKPYAGAIFIGPLTIYQLYRIYNGIKAVEFDREFLYITEKGFDIVVPLDNIKNVEIKNMGGIYKVKFFDEIQSGREIFFKPSLIYPLDFRKQDEKVNILRSYVQKVKRQIRAPLPKNALQS